MFYLVRPFRLLHGLALLPKPNPCKVLLPRGTQPLDCFLKHSMPVTSSVTVTNWPMCNLWFFAWAERCWWKWTANAWEDRTNNGKKDKALDSGGDQKQVEAINTFFDPSNTGSWNWHMSKLSYVAVPHQQAYGSTVKELYIRLQLSLPSAELSYSFAMV